MHGRKERSYLNGTGATEDTAARRVIAGQKLEGVA
jgi:hypothetical protein